MLRWICSVLFAAIVLLGAACVSHSLSDASVATAYPPGN